MIYNNATYAATYTPSIVSNTSNRATYANLQKKKTYVAFSSSIKIKFLTKLNKSWIYKLRLVKKEILKLFTTGEI